MGLRIPKTAKDQLVERGQQALPVLRKLEMDR